MTARSLVLTDKDADELLARQQEFIINYQPRNPASKPLWRRTSVKTTGGPTA